MILSCEVRFEVRIVTPCSLPGMYQYCIENCCIIMVITSLPDCMASHPATVIFKCMLMHLHLLSTLSSKMLTAFDKQCAFEVPRSSEVVTQEHAK